MSYESSHRGAVQLRYTNEIPSVVKQARSLFARAACVGFVVMSYGCAQWTTPDGDISKLPVPKMSADSVVLEIVFVPGWDLQTAAYHELWNVVDEQSLTPDVRRHINANGFRAGLLGPELPPSLRQAISEQTRGSGDKSAEPTQPTEGSNRRVLQTRSGHRYKVVAGEAYDEMIALLNLDGEVSNETYVKAQGCFSLRTHPRGDGRVAVELVPEIRHGAKRQRWVGDEGAFHLTASQDVRSLDELGMKFTLSPGQTILVGSGNVKTALGSQFFAQADDAPARQKLLLVRLAQTQIDGLYAPEQKHDPISSVVD